MDTKAQTTAYLESWAKELDARSDRVRQLIGDAHWLSDGHHKEAILREFLSRHLPSGLTITRGFVRSPAAEHNCSPEIDILVVDPTVHAPLFAESDLQIVAPTSVVAHLSVKTCLTKQNLLSALENVAETQLVIRSHADPNRVWRCICFFDVPSSRDAESVLGTVGEAISESTTRILSNLGEPSDTTANAIFSLVPTCITTLSPFTLFLTSDSASTINIRLFEIGSLSFACAFADLFSALRRWFGHVATGELDEMVEALDIPAPHSMTLSIK